MTLTQIFKSVKTRLIQILSWISPHNKIKQLFKVVNQRLERITDQAQDRLKKTRNRYQTWPLHVKRKKKSRKSVTSQTFGSTFDDDLPSFYSSDTPLSNMDQLELNFIRAEFLANSCQLTQKKFELLLKDLCSFPSFLSSVLFKRLDLSDDGTLSEINFISFWKSFLQHVDSTERTFNILKSNNQKHLTPEALLPFIEEILSSHPGLVFLKQTPHFYQKYLETVMMRIFLSINRSKSGKITLGEFRRSYLIKIFSEVDNELDINNVSDFFSYIEFYVIISKFQELDADQDGFLEIDDLLQYANHSLTRKIVNRIFETIWTRKRLALSPNNLLSYRDFIWFIMSEEDKNSPTAIEYWFQCLDLDGDGYLSEWELKYFYEEQLQRMKIQNKSAQNDEIIPFEQINLEINDMIAPSIENLITIKDIKRSKLSSYFFNILFNLPKFMAAEQTLPLSSCHQAGISDWKRFAFEEYEISRMEQEERVCCSEREDEYVSEDEDEYVDDEDEEPLPT